MSKKNAFLIHLAASLFVFSIILMLIVYVWYPAPYFDTDYRMKWIAMIAFVDVVIGPGLTLLVYRADKPTVRFDMSVILILQITALSWGVFSAWKGHPVTNVYFDGEIYCMDREELKATGAAEALIAGSMTDEIMLMLPYPETAEQKSAYLNRDDKEKPMVFSLGQYYKPVTTDDTATFGDKQSDIKKIIEVSRDYKKEWGGLLSEYGSEKEEWRYYNFHCFTGNYVAVLDRENNKIDAVLKMKLPNFWNLK